MKTRLILSLLLWQSATLSIQAQTSSLPNKLTILRTNYERAIERLKAPVDNQYRDELLKLKNEYTKAGNLEAALAVDEEIKTRFTEAPKVSRSSTGSDTQARVNTGDMVVAKLEKGVKLYTESEYIWLNIPEAYAGMKFAQPKHKHQAITTFSVQTDGIVYVAFASNWEEKDGNDKDDIASQQDMERQGWKPLKSGHLVSDERGYDWLVHARQCKAGESFTLRTTKYCAPIVLIKS